MFPPSTALWKGIAHGRTLIPEFSLTSMMAYFVTRKVCDGQNAGDFKHVNNYSYPLFKSGHIQRIMTIKGNDNNVYLNAVCLPEMSKDREYKIQMVLSPSAEILYAEDGCPAGRVGRAEYGKVKKAHPKPFPQDYNAIPLKHRHMRL